LTCKLKSSQDVITGAYVLNMFKEPKLIVGYNCKMVKLTVMPTLFPKEMLNYWKNIVGNTLAFFGYQMYMLSFRYMEFCAASKDP